jgi:hypothetical protein
MLRRPKVNILDKLPAEILLKIHQDLDLQDTLSFALTCQTFSMVSQDTHSIACTIAKRYGGYKLTLCRSILYILSPAKRETAANNVSLLGNTPAQFQTTTWAARNATVDPATTKTPANSPASRQLASFAKVLTPQVCAILQQKGALVPRYLCQLAIKDVGLVPPALFSWIVQTGLKLYGGQSQFHSDDHATVTKIVMDAVLSNWTAIRDPAEPLNEKTERDLATLQSVICEYGYIPLPTTGRTGNLSYFLFKLANMDMNLLDSLQINGFDLAAVNDEVLKWVLRRQAGSPLLKLRHFLAHGFILSPAVISHGLQLCRPDVLESLRVLTPDPEVLAIHARNTVHDLLGPKRIYTTDGILDNIRTSFSITDSTIRRALLDIPGDAVYKTRPYPQQHPATAWKWTLRHYGPDHEFTNCAFDDVLRKLASGPASHCCLRGLPDSFVNSGVKFQPEHIKYIAHIAASEDMGTLAEHLLELCKTQLQGREWVEKSAWIENIQKEAEENPELSMSIMEDLDLGSNRRSKRLRKQ